MKPKQIEVGEWLYCGCFITEFEHPNLYGKYEVYKNNAEQSHIGRAATFADAKYMCEVNECEDNFLKF